MEVALPIILFIVGFIIGAFVIWQVKKNEVDVRQRSEEELELAFSQLSRQALSENQGQFLELARNEFRKLQDDSGQQLNHKKELHHLRLVLLFDNLQLLHLNS